jgi:DNA-directed RNA polymerase specialized sigma24 family protein
MGRGKLGGSGEIPSPLRGERSRQQARHGTETCTALELRAVAEALASLRPDHREVLAETYYRGCSVTEAAATLGIPAGIVKSRTFYALKALKLALQERELAPEPSPPPTRSRG